MASANCARYCGAEVDFVDIDPRSYNMSAARARGEAGAARQARAGCPRSSCRCTWAASPCDMAAIHALASSYGFRIIEDASHAIGGSYRGEPVGNCRTATSPYSAFIR